MAVPGARWTVPKSGPSTESQRLCCYGNLWWQLLTTVAFGELRRTPWLEWRFITLVLLMEMPEKISKGETADILEIGAPSDHQKVKKYVSPRHYNSRMTRPPPRKVHGDQTSPRGQASALEASSGHWAAGPQVESIRSW